MARAEFPRKLQGLFRPARYKVAEGGRGSAKSWSFARALLILAAQDPLRILCARELQNSLQESVHHLLAEQVDGLRLQSEFKVLESTIRGRNGSEFIFSGLRHNVSKIKSMEGLDIVWVEEAEKVSEQSWAVLIPTIRKPGSEIWVSFNPDQETDPTYRRFVTNPPPGTFLAEMNWQDNPWFPEELRKEKDYLYSIDPEAAAHVWGGQCRKNSNAQVLRGRYRVEAFEPSPTWSGPHFGADWGFSTDPSTLVKVYVDPATRTLYVEWEAYGVGVEIDATPALFDRVPGGRAHVSRADSARPETISWMRRNGYPRMVAAKKGPGSVEDGVEHLRSYAAIVIHPRCIHAAEEARLWSFKVDPLTGDVLPVLVDRHNHIWDAVRYALEPLIRTIPGSGFLAWMQEQAAALEEK